MIRYDVTFGVDLLRSKERPRFNAFKRITYTPESTTTAERAIATAYKGASIRRYGRVVSAPKGVPVALKVDCYTKAPKRYPSWLPKWLRPRMPFCKKPDWDNLGKTVADALNGVAYHDDSQVTAAHVYKHDMEPDGHDRTEARICFYLPEQEQ